jgi:hypothetical protein
MVLKLTYVAKNKIVKWFLTSMLYLKYFEREYHIDKAGKSTAKNSRISIWEDKNG